MKRHFLAFSVLFALLPGLALAANGTGFFSAPVNWSTTGDLYYTVAGGPPNTCGDLFTLRNGSYLYTSSWICTDGNGNATNGPWTWASTPGNQTDKGAKIVWPDGSSTTTSDHIWDKTCHTITRTSASGAPPTAFAGRADDGTWAAGFNPNWTQAGGYFLDKDTNLYWKPGMTGYTFTGYYFVFPDVTGWPLPGDTSLTIYWNYPQVPPASAHISGHHYAWVLGIDDGDGNCFPNIELDFTAP
jgi:hypothetical protein